MPNARVDPFTDKIIDAPVFDPVHALDTDWFRPKMDALRRSRPWRTVSLDADVMVRHDISTVFDVSTRFDATGVPMIRTNQGLQIREENARAPACFPQVNYGVPGISRNAATTRLLEQWERIVYKNDARFDQPTRRDLLWEGHVNFHVLPCQDNMRSHRRIEHWDNAIPAPGVIHLDHLKPPFKPDPTQPYNLRALIGERLCRHLEALDTADITLGDQPSRYTRPLCRSRKQRVGRRATRIRKKIPLQKLRRISPV